MIGSPPFLADTTGIFSSRGPRFLVFQVLLIQLLMTRSISCDRHKLPNNITG
jgi:hypothetical protein